MGWLLQEFFRFIVWQGIFKALGRIIGGAPQSQPQPRRRWPV